MEVKSKKGGCVMKGKLFLFTLIFGLTTVLQCQDGPGMGPLTSCADFPTKNLGEYCDFDNQNCGCGLWCHNLKFAQPGPKSGRCFYDNGHSCADDVECNSSYCDPKNRMCKDKN
jgi:hypothetical protein